ncbi:MAG: glutamyl-tRNA reductase [Caldisericia bacterium]|nr:glutamyl-tRNA reductase [Caldisericia bacterium]
MLITHIGISFKTSDIDIREKLSFSKQQKNDIYKELLNERYIYGCVILCTCNRTEFYITSKTPKKVNQKVIAILHAYYPFQECDIGKLFYFSTCNDSIEHLFRVSSGIDSLLLGEDQILSQIRDAYYEATENNASDKVIHTLFQKAIHVGKKARENTQINKKAVSFGGLAIDVAMKLFGTLKDKSVLVIGTGEIGNTVINSFSKKGIARINISNRSIEKVEQAKELFPNAHIIQFENFLESLETVDIVVCCTSSSKAIITKDNCSEHIQKRNAKQILIIDIAIPRDVSPSIKDFDCVELYDMDSLRKVIEQNYFSRNESVKDVEEIISVEMQKFIKWLSLRHVVPMIKLMKENAEEIKSSEIERAMNRLEKFSEREKTIVEDMAHSIVYRMLHNPIEYIKKIDYDETE